MRLARYPSGAGLLRDRQKAGRTVVISAQPAQRECDMNTLRQKLIDESEVRGLARNTKEPYVGFVSRLARYYDRSPDRIGYAELRGYLLQRV